MNFLQENKIYIIGIVLVLAGIWAYMTFFMGDTSSATLTTDQKDSPLSQDVLVTLSSLHTIKLDDSIFKDPIFISLTDYGVAIPPQDAGRSNPFIPL